MLLKLRSFAPKNFINFLIFFSAYFGFVSRLFRTSSPCREKFFPSADRTARFCHQKCTPDTVRNLPDSSHRISSSPAYPERSSVRGCSNFQSRSVCRPSAHLFSFFVCPRPLIIGSAFQSLSCSSLKMIHCYVFWT